MTHKTNIFNHFKAMCGAHRQSDAFVTLIPLYLIMFHRKKLIPIKTYDKNVN